MQSPPELQWEPCLPPRGFNENSAGCGYGASDTEGPPRSCPAWGSPPKASFSFKKTHPRPHLEKVFLFPHKSCYTEASQRSDCGKLTSVGLSPLQLRGSPCPSSLTSPAGWVLLRLHLPTSLNQPLLPWDQKPGAVGTLKSSCGQRRPGSRVQGALLSGSSTGETRPISEASPSEPALLAVPPPALHPTPGGTQTRPQAPDPHRQQASRSPKPLGCGCPPSVQGVGACGQCSSRSPVVQWASVHPPVATRPASGRPGPPRCP